MEISTTIESIGDKFNISTVFYPSIPSQPQFDWDEKEQHST